MIYKPHAYQDHATEHILENPNCGLFMEMGLGKTIATLTAIDRLLNDTLEINKVLVIAPLRVAQEVWSGEIEKWDHLKHLRVSKILGTEPQRKAALLRKADIYLINVENLVWLTAQCGSYWPFDMHVFDESSKFKDQNTIRFKAIRKKQPFVKRTVLLTGTPTGGSLIGLWPQMYLLDKGARLFDTLTQYRDKYFRKKDNGFGWEIRKEDKNSVLGEGIYEKEIYDRIGDICISMKKSDYLELPPVVQNDVFIPLPAEVLKKYNDFERDCVLALSEEKEITAINAGALTTKLLQYANGAVYDAEKTWHQVHTAKLEALEEIVEAAGGNSVLVAYAFKSDLDRIQAYFKAYRPRVLKTPQDFKDWNSGQITIGIIHPASGGHGLNLQFGGHIVVWFSRPWSLELNQQLPARLDRQGQEHTVIEHTLICRGTIDEDVIHSLKDKNTMQNALMKAVKARIKKYFVN